MISILDHNITDTSYYAQIELYLGFLSYWKLIDFNIEKRNDNTGRHKYYKIKKINRIEEAEDFEIETAAPVSKEFVEKIKAEINGKF